MRQVQGRRDGRRSESNAAMGRKSSAKAQTRDGSPMTPKGPEPPDEARSSTPITALIIIAVVAVVGAVAYVNSGKNAVQPAATSADHSSPAQAAGLQGEPRWAKHGPHKQA